MNYVNPGVCKTELSRNYKGEYRTFADYAFNQHGRTAEMGSRTILHGVVADKESHGCYLSACENREYVLTDLWETVFLPTYELALIANVETLGLMCLVGSLMKMASWGRSVFGKML